ncbi:M20 family metallo-hydrolase [Adhaeribacter swui]|uniref:M20 family metallo-hydrolase n=1 Tax=Adhaeribacter swui TaxID=2086471 RepID=A0A7G7GCS0_9BACT|nr:M20 family metallo-hydrolase [Adhaeribacter swui]QNF34954.1 M20 family metallo-hydrolase [Adhaeribacter swui]
MPQDSLYEEAVQLLKSLIATESFSRQEENTADILHNFFKKNNIETHRERNNLWAFNKHYHPNKPTILLNSHHDTVKPNKDWTKDPFTPIVEEDKLYGLGSNDAGGCLVALLATFRHYYDQENLAYNLIMAATAEEEVSGVNGIELIIPQLGPIEFAIVGEPTQMHLAIAEKGLMVLDCLAKGTSGHAAREEGDNAIYKALPDINWIQNFKFPVVSELLGPVKMSVTVIKAGTQHNVVPDTCQFTVDVRVTDAYTSEEVLEIIKAHVACDVKPRSMRLKPSRIGKDTPVVQAGLALGRKLYGSPTTSDQALLTVPSLKLGPGDSARSHTADEFIYLSEIQEGITLYIQLLDKIIYE